MAAAQRQVAETEKAADGVLRRLSKVSKRVRLLEGEALVLKSRIRIPEKALDVAVPNFDGWMREVRPPEVRVRMLCDELGSLKRRESMICNLEANTCKVAEAQGDTVNLITGLHWNTVWSYYAICCGVHGALV